MTTKKTPPIQQHTNKQHPTAKPTNRPEKATAAHPATPAKHSSAHKTATPPPKQLTRQQVHTHDHQPATSAHSHRRRRQTFGQRLAHLSGGSWLAILTGVVVIGIIVFALIASRGSATPGTTAEGLLANGTTAPAIAALPAPDGKSYSLAQYKGKVVVLEFFAPWCPHCQNETTALKQLQQDYGSKGVQVLGVSASPYGRNWEQGDQTPISMVDVSWFSSTYNLNYPLLFDSSLKAGNDYKVTGFPTMYIVNKQGVITYSASGEVSYASLQQQVNQALGQ